MKLTWIIENFTDSQDYRDLIDAVRESGRNCYAIDKRNHLEFDPAGFQENQLVLFQGSIQMSRYVKERLPKGCYPVVFCNDDAFYCHSYYPRLERFLFNDKYALMTLAELKENKFDYYADYGKEAMIFVRPSRGDKVFTGQLLDLQDFDRFWKNNVVCNASDSNLVVVSTPKNLNGEWRFVVDKWKNIIAVSTYQYQGQKCLIPSAPKGATEKVLEILEANYHPDPVYCIDIAEDNDGNFWLLELTSFSSAGLYETDKKKIVDAVNDICENML